MGPIGAQSISVDIELAGVVLYDGKGVADGVTAGGGVRIEDAEAILAPVVMVLPQQVETSLKTPDMAIELWRQLVVHAGNCRRPILLGGSAEQSRPSAGHLPGAVQQGLIAVPRMELVD